MVFAGFWGFLITSRSSVQIRPPPLKPRCRNIFDPGVFSCAEGEKSPNRDQYPKSPQQLAYSPVLGQLPLANNSDTAKLRSRLVSVPGNAFCLSNDASTVSGTGISVAGISVTGISVSEHYIMHWLHVFSAFHLGSSRWKPNLATRSRHHFDHAAFHWACPGGSESGCRARC